MPELPHALRSRLQSQYGISARDADILMSIQSGSDVGFDGEPPKGGAVGYFEEVAKASDPKEAINWRVLRAMTICYLLTPLTGSHMNFSVSSHTEMSHSERIRSASQLCRIFSPC